MSENRIGDPALGGVRDTPAERALEDALIGPRPPATSAEGEGPPD